MAEMTKAERNAKFPRSAWSDNSKDVWIRDMIAAGHTPRMYDGEIDMFVMDYGYHNGPGCETCGWSCCQHCHGEAPIPQCTNPKAAS